jgi:GT2 family glycosyltransferase
MVNETKKTKWTMQDGIFKTYTLNGACFLAKTDILRECGWFDPTYTFTPEDIALGTLFNKEGYSVYTDADIEITHIANATASQIETAIKPTRVRGSLIFYSSIGKISPNQGTDKCNPLIYSLMGAFIWCFEAVRELKYMFCDCSDKNEKTRRNRLMRDTAANVRKHIFTKKTTKEIFTDLYNQIKQS